MLYFHDFISNIKGLTKNPLGIIALFISMIYGFACLVLSTSLTNLHSENERLPLLWFIILFPLIILVAFIYLVVYHHEKLYAPSDFRDDGSFIETMNGKRIKEKQEEEVDVLVSAAPVNEFKGGKEESEYVTFPNRDSIKSENGAKYHINSGKEKLEKDELIDRYRNAEKWGIRELGLKYNLKFKQNQAFAAGSSRIEVDAYASDSKRVVIGEVKYWESNRAIKPLLLVIQEFILKYDIMKQAFGKNRDVELVFVLVFDSLNGVNVKEIKSFVSELNPSVALEIREYSVLEDEYRENS